MIEHDNRCVGSTRITHVDQHNRRAHFNIGIFDRSVWDIGLGTETTRLLIAYAFDTLRLHRLEVRVLDFNHRAIRAYQKAGFRREGIEREGSLIGGVWCSDVHLGILAHEFRDQG